MGKLPKGAAVFSISHLTKQLKSLSLVQLLAFERVLEMLQDGMTAEVDAILTELEA